MALADKLTNADLANWTDPAAELHEREPSDPAEHFCMYHGEDRARPVTVTISTRWPMVGTSCRPCGESILAALHGMPWTGIPLPAVVRQAAALSVFMAKVLGDHEASVTELRPRITTERRRST